MSFTSTTNTTNTTTHDIFAGLLAGFMSVFLIIYAFQPNRPYPSWMLEPAEKPWLFVIIIITIVYLLKWDYLIGILVLLFTLAVILDIIIFTRQITDVMEIPEPLFTPSIDLIPSLKISERFGNKNDQEMLQKRDQVSKKWTINLQPEPYQLRHNPSVDDNDDDDRKLEESIAGKPLFDDTIPPMSYYPVFAPTV